MITKKFSLFELVDWFEALLDDRDNHQEEFFQFFAGEERYVEISISVDGICASGLTNFNLSPWEWLTEQEELKLGVLGWVAEEVDTAEPKFVRRWAYDAPTSVVSTQFLQVLTAVYLAPQVRSVEVLRGSFSGGHVDWDTAA